MSELRPTPEELAGEYLGDLSLIRDLAERIRARDKAMQLALLKELYTRACRMSLKGEKTGGDAWATAREQLRAEIEAGE